MKRLMKVAVLFLLITTHQVVATDYYVDAARPDDLGNGLSWTTAKQTIQAAVDLTSAGDVVRVNDGLYDSGGTVTPGYSLTNRVHLNKSIELRSENGPDATFIVGAPATGGGGGADAIRGMYVSVVGTKVIGFTFTNGFTTAVAQNFRDCSGGAICADIPTSISNCTFVGNAAYSGGALGGHATVRDSRFIDNTAINDGGATTGDIHVYDCRFIDNTAGGYGGAMNNGTADDTAFIKNHSSQSGGAISGGQIARCSFTENSTSWHGGGMYYGTAISSTFTSNSAYFGGGGYGLTADHCIFNGNTGIIGAGMSGGTADFCTFSENIANEHGGGMSSSTAGSSGEGWANYCYFTDNTARQSGGAIFQGSASNCTIYGNSAANGGGIHTTVANNSIITANSATDGGGMYQATLNNCTISGNKASRDGGGSYQGTANNSIVWHNSTERNGQNMYSPSGDYSCSPDLTHGSSNCITNNPALISNSHLSTGSLCVGAGSASFNSGIDIDYSAWSSPPAMGCDEPDGVQDTAVFVEINGLPSHILTGREAVAQVMVLGEVSSFNLDFGNGHVVYNELGLITNVWTSGGIYPVKLTTYRNPGQIAKTITRNVNVATPTEATLYVSLTGNDTNNGLSWAEAKASVQSAIDTQPYPGGRVLLTNGTYQLEEEILIDKEVAIDSVNGPEFTILDGRGSNRCIQVDRDISCLISSLTISNGYTTYYGGGISCYDETPVVSNCIITANVVINTYGGGMYYGTAINCIFSNNGTLEDPEYEEYYSCYGGGMAMGVAKGCLFVGNTSDYYGGGIYYSTLNNCTLTENTAEYGGGAYDGYMTNCIAWNNTASGDNDLYLDDPAHTCSPDAPHGTDGCITNAPLFLDAANGNYQLHHASPCIDAGDSTGVTIQTDLAGHPRTLYEAVDMGCYEWVAPPYWLAKSTAQIIRSIAVGQTTSDAQIQIWNLETANMSYTLSADVAWINLSPISGNSSGERDPISIAFDTTGLAIGSYTGLITITSAEASNTPQTIEVITTLYEPILDHFEWSTFGSSQTVGTPINLSIKAADENGFTVPSFTGIAQLSGWIPGMIPNERTIGTGTDTSNYPMCTRNHDARQQNIYLQSEIGGARIITSLALDVVTPPGQTMENWTIRMRHTTLDNYDVAAAWASGWTTVLQKNATVSSTGWVSFTFDTPFEYNGIDNLMIDFSHNNSSYSSYGYCAATETLTARSLEYRTNSDYYDPLDWIGSSDPEPYAGYYPPNIKLNTLIAAPVSITPANTGNFSAGLWAGNVTVQQAATNMLLLADDGSGHSGQSHLFNVQLDSDQDGIPDSWEALYFGGPTNAVATALSANGINTILECYIADLNPASSSAAFIITGFNTGTILFDSSTDRLYNLLWRTNLVSGSWQPQNPPRVGTGNSDSFSSTNETQQGFYRIEVYLP